MLSISHTKHAVHAVTPSDQIKSNCLRCIMLIIATSQPSLRTWTIAWNRPNFRSIFEPSCIFCLLYAVLKILSISLPLGPQKTWEGKKLCIPMNELVQIFSHRNAKSKLSGRGQSTLSDRTYRSTACARHGLTQIQISIKCIVCTSQTHRLLSILEVFYTCNSFIIIRWLASVHLNWDSIEGSL